MFSHIMVGANDLVKARKFYDATLGVLGVPAPFMDGHRFFYRTKTGVFGVTKPIDGKGATHANGGTIGFACASAEQVYGWCNFEVLAYETGNPKTPVNAIPPRAWARCQLRHVVGIDQAAVLPAIRRHLDRQGLGMVQVLPGRDNDFNATRLDPQHPWAQFAAVISRLNLLPAHTNGTCDCSLIHKDLPGSRFRLGAACRPMPRSKHRTAQIRARVATLDRSETQQAGKSAKGWRLSRPSASAEAAQWQTCNFASAHQMLSSHKLAVQSMQSRTL